MIRLIFKIIFSFNIKVFIKYWKVIINGILNSHQQIPNNTKTALISKDTDLLGPREISRWQGSNFDFIQQKSVTIDSN